MADGPKGHGRSPGQRRSPGSSPPRRGGSGGSKPPGPGRRPARPGGSRPGSPYRLEAIGSNRFVLKPPRQALEMEADLEVGLELWEAGDPESAQDALRFALEGFGDSIEIHEALGRLSREALSEPDLAVVHYERAYEIICKTVGPRFTGCLPPEEPANAVIYRTLAAMVDGFKQVGEPGAARRVESLARRWSNPGSSSPPRSPRAGRFEKK